VLGPNEQRVVKVIVANPVVVVEYSIVDLAAEANTSPPTVTRA